MSQETENLLPIKKQWESKYVKIMSKITKIQEMFISCEPKMTFFPK